MWTVHPSVREAQRLLNRFDAQDAAAGGFGLLTAPLAEDCIYGPLTKSAVMLFQQRAFEDRPSEWDGIVGPKTWAKLDEAGRYVGFPAIVPGLPGCVWVPQGAPAVILSAAQSEGLEAVPTDGALRDRDSTAAQLQPASFGAGQLLCAVATRPPEGITTDECKPDSVSSITQAFADTQRSISITVAKILAPHRTPATNAALELYFGKSGPKHVAKIALKLLFIKRGLQGEQFQCHYPGDRFGRATTKARSHSYARLPSSSALAISTSANFSSAAYRARTG